MTLLQEAFPNGEPNWLPTCDESKKLHDAESAFIRTALAQQGEQPVEPTDDQLVKGVKAMRLFVTKNSVADFKLGYMAALAAAPAPQVYDSGCYAEEIEDILRSEIKQLKIEMEALRRANLDCVDHYNDAVAELARFTS